MRRPRICPAQMCPWASAASATYSSKVFTLLLFQSRRGADGPQGLRGKLHVLLFTLPGRFPSRPRNIERDPVLARAIRTYAHAQPDAVRLLLHAVHRGRDAVLVEAVREAQFIGPGAQRQPVAAQVAGEIRTRELAAQEPHRAGVFRWIQLDDVRLQEGGISEQPSDLFGYRMPQHGQRLASLRNAA